MKLKQLLLGLSMVVTMGALAQPAYWFIDTPDPGDITMMPNTENFTEGVQSCEMILHTTNVPYFKSDNFDVDAGASYTFYLDVLDNDTRGRLKVYADFYDADGNDIYGEAPVYSEDNAEWQSITWSAVVPDGAVAGYVWIKFYDQDDFTDEAIIFVDNASFVEDGGENLVINGGYEEWTLFGIENAYFVGETAVDVRYNGVVETVDPADFTLSGTSVITFANAQIDAGDATLVHLTGASEAMVFDLTVDELTQTGLEGVATASLYAGTAPIAYTNAIYPDGSLQNGISATFTGIISAHDAYNDVWIHDAAGEYNGVMIFSYSFQEEVALGDEIIFTAQRDEYYNLSELVSPILLQTISTGNSPYDTSEIMGADINITLAANTESAEKWEGQLVVINNAVVTEYNEEEFYYLCTDDEGATQFKVGDNVDYQLANVVLTVGDVYRITGVVDYSYDFYRINPRNADDVENTTGIHNLQETSFSVYPNPVRDVLNISVNDAMQSLSIINMNGSLIKEIALNGSHNTTISVAGLEAGVYLLRVKTSNETLTQRLVIR